MLPDELDAAHAINLEGCEHQRRNDFIAAIDCYRRALALFEQAGDAHGRIMVLVNLGEVHCFMNDGVQATRHLCQAQALIDATPDTDPRLVGAVLGHRGWAAALTGNLDAAEGLLLRGLHAIRLHADTASQKRDMLKNPDRRHGPARRSRCRRGTCAAGRRRLNLLPQDDEHLGQGSR